MGVEWGRESKPKDATLGESMHDKELGDRGIDEWIC